MLLYGNMSWTFTQNARFEVFSSGLSKNISNIQGTYAGFCPPVSEMLNCCSFAANY